MNIAHLRAGDFTRQPWKNGAGVTTQLALHEEGERWVWRLSLAEVAQSGPFSDFAGYERTIMLVEGAGMELEVDGRATDALRLPYRPFVFDGGARTRCSLLSGPVKDLNLIVDRARAGASLDVIDTNRFRGTRLEARWTLAYALRGWTRVVADAVECTLAPGELLRLDGARGADLDLVGLDQSALVALVRIEEH
jgi:environmental stress-induced protein Ves